MPFLRNRACLALIKVPTGTLYLIPVSTRTCMCAKRVPGVQPESDTRSERIFALVATHNLTKYHSHAPQGHHRLFRIQITFSFKLFVICEQLSMVSIQFLRCVEIWQARAQREALSFAIQSKRTEPAFRLRQPVSRYLKR